MFDERAFIARVEATDPDGFRKIMASPSKEQESALRAHFGPERYQHLHGKALRRGVQRGGAPPDRGNVVVLHGVMGSALDVVDLGLGGDNIWVNLLRILDGSLDKLRLGDDGLTGADVRVTGILKRYYGDLLLSLTETWNVRAFCFDWRKDINVAADDLRAQLGNWFSDTAPVHLVAHSMGGLVARTFIGDHPGRWESMWDPGDSGTKRAPGTHGGRLIMLGTPNHGSFAIPQAIFGLDDIIQKLALLDLRHDVRDLLDILNSFVGSFQMLPSPIGRPELEPLYKPATYGDLKILERRLAAAREQHDLLKDVVDPARMIYIAGSNRATFNAITDFENLGKKESYSATWEGDGRVPHELGRLESAAGKVPTYYVDDDHGGLPENPRLLAALDELLTTGMTEQLPDSSAAARPRGAAAPPESSARDQLEADQAHDLARLQSLLHRSPTWRRADSMRQSGSNRLRSAADDNALTVSFVGKDESEIEESLTRGLLASRDPHRPVKKPAPISIEIRVVGGGIDDLDKIDGIADGEPVDAIAVGHYLLQRPEGPELDLDRAISKPPGSRAGKATDADLLITQLSDRGTIRGELGQTFLLPDPREAGAAGMAGTERIIAIAGMGVPGRFGGPELTVVSRELCWALGRMGKRHLATVLIGAGKGNLAPAEAALAWIHGIKNAVTGTMDGEARRLHRITFVERDPARVRIIERAIQNERDQLQKVNRLIIDFKPLDAAALGKLERSWRRFSNKRQEELRRLESEAPEELVPTRLSATLDQGAYRFGALTESASIPEREVLLDSELVRVANDKLAGTWDTDRQYERGRFLGQLLLPAEFRPQLSTAAPLVLQLDAKVARVHWEMIAQDDEDSLSSSSPGDGTDGTRSREDADVYQRRFLGTSRGVTRQLRTTFAPPPQPPPPPRRVMRVLVIADPAEDDRLPGAEAEGATVADLFENFNRVHEETDNRIEVVKLLGPQEATRDEVLLKLMQRSYDVLHFAGHCTYDEDHPEASGWIFSNRTRISARELDRIDRVPGFIFSNACESGITAQHPELRADALAPSFAEAFFKRGVSNFVCTAWPVDDMAALEFALALYERMLGMDPIDQSHRQFTPTTPAQMHVAMREARLEILKTPNGIQTWGAYQHYGNPYLRFFDPASMAASTNGKA